MPDISRRLRDPIVLVLRNHGSCPRIIGFRRPTSFPRKTLVAEHLFAFNRDAVPIERDAHLAIVFGQCALQVGLSPIDRDFGVGQHLLLGEDEKRIAGSGAELLQLGLEVLDGELKRILGGLHPLLGGFDLRSGIAHIDDNILLDHG